MDLALQHASRVVNRSEAAFALGAVNSAEAIAALERAGTEDPFFGIRVDAAQSLGRIRSEETRPALLKMLADKDAQVRTAAAGSLSSLKKNDDAIARLFDLARNDSYTSVRQTALVGAARMKPDKGLDLVKPFLDIEATRPAAVLALRQLADEASVPTLLELSHDSNDRVRLSALGALGPMGKGKQPVMDRLLEALEDADNGDRQTAIYAAMAHRDMAAIPALQRLADSDPLPNIARAARSAVEALRAPAPQSKPEGAAGASDELSPLRTRLSELEKENAELKARLDRLEKK